MKARLYSILRAYRRALTNIYGDRFRQMILFGSHARGEANEESDVDLLIVLEGPIDPFAELERTREITYNIALKNSINVERIFATLEQLQNSDFRIFKSLRDEGVAA